MDNHGSSAISGGAITVMDSDISGNTGIGVFGSADLLIADSAISNNGNMGVQDKTQGSVQILRSSISGNLGVHGGLWLWGGGTFLNTDSTISGNVATSPNGGGGVYFTSGGKLTIQGSTFADNRASAGGGLLADGNLEIRDSEFRGNEATSAFGNGGAILLTGSSNYPIEQLISRTTFEGNWASGSGGAIYIAGNRTADLTADTFIANTADFQGGAIAIDRVAGPAIIRQATIHGNHTAGSGGGLYISGGSHIHVEDSTIDFNTAHSNGGGVLISGPGEDTTLSQTTISSNTANGGGGVVLLNVNSFIPTISNCTITLNSSGIVASGSGGMKITHSIIAGNLPLDKAQDISSSIKNLDLSYSLIGNSSGSGLTPAPVGAPDAHGNLIGGTYSCRHGSTPN